MFEHVPKIRYFKHVCGDVLDKHVQNFDVFVWSYQFLYIYWKENVLALFKKLRLLKLFFWSKLLRLVSEVNFPDQKYFTVAHNIIGNDRHFSL